MEFSRRRLLGAAGTGALASLSGCSSVLDSVSSATGGTSLPEGSLSSAIAETTYAPGSRTDSRHLMLSVRDIDALRDDRDENHVADALVDRPLGKAENGFELDPATVSAYGQYGPVEMFVGSFDREPLIESFKADGWSVVGTHHGIDVLDYPKHGEYYGAGVGDGLLFTGAQYRTVPATEFVRAHAEATAGERPRYTEDAQMRALLDVVGGGDYVTAITSPSDLGERPPNTRAVGRSIVVDGSGLKTTFAFYFDEDALESPETIADEWADRYTSQQSLSNLSLNATAGARGRVGYFTTRYQASNISEDGTVEALKERDPTESMSEKVAGRYADLNARDPPEMSFEFRHLPNATDGCGRGDNVIELTLDRGPTVPARRLAVGATSEGQGRVLRSVGRCYDSMAATISPGDTVKIAFPFRVENKLIVFWNGPHGGSGRFPIQPAENT